MTKSNYIPASLGQTCSTHKIGNYSFFLVLWWWLALLHWFAVVCGGLRWFAVVCGGLRWFAVVCGGLRWFAVVCGGLHPKFWWWFEVVPVVCGSL